MLTESGNPKQTGGQFVFFNQKLPHPCLPKIQTKRYFPGYESTNRVRLTSEQNADGLKVMKVIHLNNKSMNASVEIHENLPQTHS